MGFIGTFYGFFGTLYGFSYKDGWKPQPHQLKNKLIINNQ